MFVVQTLLNDFFFVLSATHFLYIENLSIAEIFRVSDCYLTGAVEHSICITAHRYTVISIIMKSLVNTLRHSHASPHKHIASTQ